MLSTFPTNYIAEPATLASVHQVLVENGRFIIVPEGHLTGSSWLHHLIDWLFRITGQREGTFELGEAHNWPHPDLWEPFRQRFLAAGFQLSIEQVQLKRSAVTVFVAEKVQ